MSELSTDALHMTSPLRTGRRVGRTIYAQLGPEPSDADPLVATADSPVLAERIVRAVNAAAPVAREDTASPDEASRAVACPDCGGVVGVLDSIPSLAPVIDDHKWLGVLCSGSGTTLDRPVPAQPTMAPDVQRAAPTRDLDAVARALVGELSVAFEAGRNWAPGGAAWDTQNHARRIAARLTSGVLRGGGADGGGEDPRIVRQRKVIKLLQRVLAGHHRMDRVTMIPSIEDALFGTDDGEMLNDEDATVPVGEFRRLLREQWAPAAGPAERQWAATQFEEHDAAIARLATAVGVSPDSEDVVGAIEAAILAGREPEVVTPAEAADLPAGSIVRPRAPQIAGVNFVPSFRESSGGWTAAGSNGPAAAPSDLYPEWYVLWRAPALAPAPLTAGDEVKTPEQLAALPEHTVLRDASFDVCERMHDRWKCFTGTDHVDLPARILDLPGGEEA